MMRSLRNWKCLLSSAFTLLPEYHFASAAGVRSMSAFEHDSQRQQSGPFSVIFVLGAPGSGKGTQCALLSKHYSCVHLSAGEIIRREHNSHHSQFKREIGDVFAGKRPFVPAEITCELLRRAMLESGGEMFLIDAFPVNQENLDVWVRQMSTAAVVSCVLFIETPEEVCKERCRERRRLDDNEAKVQARADSYRRETKPIVEHFREKGLLKAVDGSLEPSAVFQSILDTLGPDPFRTHVRGGVP